MLTRDPASHKGENGKVLIIGGSRLMHGAPILSLLAAEAAGADLLFLALPACHESTARQRCLNVLVHPFHGDEIGENDVDPLLELMATADCAVIGPGLGRQSEQLTAIASVLSSAVCPLVIDASALQRDTLDHVRGKPAVLTPHRGELERMGVQPDQLGATAAEYGVVIHQKGPTDRIANSDGRVTEVTGGNAGLTVGGTGDVLAGLIAGLIAQRMAHADACALASRTVKRAGEILSASYGFAYRAQDVIGLIPSLLQGERQPDRAMPKKGPLIA